MDLRFTLELGNKRSKFDDHSLFFLAKVFDEAITSLLPEGKGLWNGLEPPYPFSSFKNRKYEVLHSIRYHHSLDFRPDVDELQWKQNRIPIRGMCFCLQKLRKDKERRTRSDEVKTRELDGQRGQLGRT
ncbi:hypothetical protein F5880DRAFT_1502413 [Lentinula raphanica]|nr:hypothetical protein F5880DRAFT_1502413 [Lentinula raphanica]